MKIGVMMCALKEERMIVPAIRQFDGFGVEVVVACSEKSWHGGQKGDRTAELAVGAGATVRRFDWKDEKDQKNWIMDKMNDKDWVLMFAPDMFMTNESLNNLLYFLDGSASQQNERAYSCDMATYWKDFDTVIVPETPFNTVSIRPQERFLHSATLHNYQLFPRAPGVYMHHLSWVRTDEEVKRKLTTWSHAQEVKEGWYERYWLHEDPEIEMKDFSPTNPTDYKGLVKFPLPDELRSLIKKYERN